MIRYYWNNLPQWADAADYYRVGFDFCCVYIFTTPFGIQCIYGAGICFGLAGLNWLISRSR